MSIYSNKGGALKRTAGILLSAVLFASAGAPAQETSSEFVPVTNAMLQNPDPADWLMWRRTLDAWGHSPLSDITRENVGRLQMVWSRGMRPGSQEGTPLVYDGVMYLPNPSDVIQALDAATGDQIWEYRRVWPADLKDFLLFPEINRNIAIYHDLIIDTSGDTFVFALNAVTGELAWENRILDYRVNAANHTSGPIIADGKIISGRNCHSEGGPEACAITAHDARTGQELWRTLTVPRPGEPGDETWGGVPFDKRWHVGTWMVPSYDPGLGLIYIGTSVTSPAPKFLMDADATPEEKNARRYLYHNSTLALDIDTGEIVWYYQHLPDHWDLDHVYERLLIDTAVRPDPAEVSWINPNLEPGESRRVMTGIPGKTGLVYTLDAETGEFLWARPTVAQTVVDSIDGATGEVQVNPEMLFTAPGQSRMVCPGQWGGKNWPYGTYSPTTHTMFFPLQNMCMEAISSEPGRVYDFLETGTRQMNRYGYLSRIQLASGTENVGAIHAVSVETGATVWRYEQRAAATSLLSTGGGLVFGGDSNGRFRALDQDSGDVLWEVNIGSAVSGPPISYAVAGRQYVAVSTGANLTTRVWNGQTPELTPTLDNTMFVFALPEAP